VCSSDLENNLRRAVTIADGDYWTLLHSPLSISLWSVAVIGFILPLFFGRIVKARMRTRRDGEGATPD